MFFSFQEPNYIKRISDANYRYEFYTLSKKIKTKKNRVYYWFKGGAIHSSQNGVTGELIDGLFTKTSHNNHLIEQGVFKKGLKNGVWKKWHLNGKIEAIQKWSYGKMDGEYLLYNDNGNLITKGKYNNNEQSGKWIDYIKKDTTVFKKGVVQVKEKEISKEDKLKLKEDKKKKRELEKANNQKKNKNVNDTTKQSFIKRIFSKKDKENNNGKGT